MNFYERVRQKADGKYGSLQEFFISIEISPSSFYTWEERGNLPRADEAYKIAQALGTSVEFLLTGIEQKLASDELLNEIRTSIEKYQKKL